MPKRGVRDMNLREIAQRRHDIHKSHASSRPLSKDYELVGLSGEVAFAEFSGLGVDWEERPSGDKGIDFTTPNGKTIDVKTARKAYNLIHEENKSFADIYVLAQYIDNKEESILIGWEYGHVLKKSPRKDFGYGIINHYINKNKLNSMQDLKEICGI